MASETADPTPSAGIPLAAYGHLLTIYLVWGAAYLAVKVCISGPAYITVFQLQSGRMWCAALLLALLATVRHGRPKRPSARDLGICAASGLLMWVAGNGLATLASRHAASSFIVMALGAIPLWSCMLDLLIERAVPSGRVLAGLLLGLAGLFLVMAPALTDASRAIIEPGYAGFTAAILVIAGISWSLGTIVQRPLLRRVPVEWAASFQMTAAALVLSMLALGEGSAPPSGFGTHQLLAFGFLVVFASVIGLTSYIKVLRTFRPVVASTFAYVNPVVGVLLGTALLGETPAPISLAGLMVVLVSIGIVLTRPT